MQVRKPPSLRRNNGSIQIRVRVGGEDRRIHRLGRWDDPQAVARAQAISAQIWSDYRSGALDPTLQRYQALVCSTGLSVDGCRVELLGRLRVLAERKRYGRALHTSRLMERYPGAIKSQGEAVVFVKWMEEQGLSASTRKAVVSTIRSVHPWPEVLTGIRIKVPKRTVMEEVLSPGEIQRLLGDLREQESWFYACFALWLGTGLRNSELIGLRWDAVRWDNRELVISRTLRRDGNSNHRRVWGSTKTGQSRVVPLHQALVEVLREHQKVMESLGLDTVQGLVFVSPRSHGHLYEGLLERVWKRSQGRVGITPPRRLYAQRHSLLSHALAMGNSPADVAAMAGHRTEELLRTYAKATGRLQLPVW